MPTTPPTFPTLPGLGFPVHKRPTSSTRIAKHVSQREVRAAMFQNDLYEFEVVIEGMDSTGVYSGLGTDSLQALIGLYVQCQGSFGTFLYTDSTDNAVTAQAIATGDGSSTAFTLVRSLNGTPEPVSWVTTLSAVYLNGTARSSSAYSLTEPNTLTFTTAPSLGVAITADFSYAFRCRFLDDQADFEEFMSGLFKMDSLKFKSIATS